MHMQNRRPSLLVFRDDITDPERIEKSASDCAIDYFSLAESKEINHDYSAILFHAADNEKDSLHRLKKIKERFPATPVTFLVRRDQAPQIGTLLEQGADKCFVKQLYPNEVNRALHALQEQGLDALGRIQPWA